MEPTNQGRILAAELVGTLVLMLGGPGVAILLPALGLLPDGDASTGAGLLKILIIALGFGLSLLIMAYVIGPITGCHINPAVTLGMLLARKISTRPRGVRVDRPDRRGGRRRGHHLRHRQRAGRVPAWPVRRQPVDRQVLRARLDDHRRGAAHRPARDGRAVHHDEEVRPRHGRAGDRLHADVDPPDLDPGRQHVGEPGAQPRHGLVRRQPTPTRCSSCGRSSSSR